MHKHRFEGANIRVAGLFNRGAGGRHDWMRFHVTDVPCPQVVDDRECTGHLKWSDKDNLELTCVACKARFQAKLKVRIPPIGG
jgi:hypothetical protein